MSEEIGSLIQTMDAGDKVLSISKTGKRKGQQGTLVKKEGTEKWIVRWADGVEKPYSVNKLKKISIRKDGSELANDPGINDVSVTNTDLTAVEPKNTKVFLSKDPSA